MPVSVNVSGTWRSVPYPKVNISGGWRDVQNIYVNVSGSWKAMYSYWYSYGSWGSCSATCGGGTQTRSATCYRTGSVTCSDDYCTRAGVGKEATSQECNTQSCTTCKKEYRAYPRNPTIINAYYIIKAYVYDCHGSSEDGYWDDYNDGTLVIDSTHHSSITLPTSISGYTYTLGSSGSTEVIGDSWDTSDCAESYGSTYTPYYYIYEICRTPGW